MRKRLAIENFIAENPDWEAKLALAPYSLKIKREGQYVLFIYDQLNSDFSLDIVRESRGTIFYDDGRELILVCLPFKKFFNIQEIDNAAKIDWNSAVVLEKVDGSLMKLWFHNGQWRLSTNRNIDAFNSPVHKGEGTYGAVFEIAAGCDIQTFAERHDLKKHKVYMFELVSPETRVVISYSEPEIYFLESRDMLTLEEAFEDIGVKTPKRYYLNNRDDIMELVAQMSQDEEGVVVCDRYFARVKIKSKAYLNIAYLNNNGVLTDKRLISMWRNGQLDDYVAFMPERKDIVDDFYDRLDRFKKSLKASAAAFREFLKTVDGDITRKELFAKAATFGNTDYLMKIYDGRADTAEEYIDTMIDGLLEKILKSI